MFTSGRAFWEADDGVDGAKSKRSQGNLNFFNFDEQDDIMSEVSQFSEGKICPRSTLSEDNQSNSGEFQMPEKAGEKSIFTVEKVDAESEKSAILLPSRSLPLPVSQSCQNL